MLSRLSVQDQTKSTKLNAVRSSRRPMLILRDTVVSMQNLTARRQQSVKASIDTATEILLKKKEHDMACKVSFPPVAGDNMPEYVKGVVNHLFSCVTEPTACVSEYRNLYEW